jgi:diguanylate cyclase (GGDEF)-like protein
VYEKKPVVHNDYASLPHRRGLPEGHAQVIRELVAPVLRDEKVVAILGVGNKPVDYTQEDVDIVAYLADVTWQIVEQKRAEETITRMAYHDPLTGLPNRMLFNDRLNLAMPSARRRQERLALMMMDLDGFKEVNDTLGHEVGDRLLQLVAERLTSLVRESDTVARIGGDEFSLLLPGVADIEDAATAADKIVRGFDRAFVLDGHELRVTTSVGIALYPEDGEDAGSLMRHADRAMYEAKRAGKGTYQRYAAAGTDEFDVSRPVTAQPSA